MLKLDTILDWWRDRNESSGSRLILILDTEFSHQWIREVCRISGHQYVGVQTCTVSKTSDPEISQPGIGDFTMDWIDYNCTDNNHIDWKDKERLVKAVYGVSRHWSDFRFHLPTKEDIAIHWHSNFPRLTGPFVNCLQIENMSIFSCCDCVLKCLKRKKMTWLPPAQLDTGHGFKLIRS